METAEQLFWAGKEVEAEVRKNAYETGEDKNPGVLFEIF